MNQQRKTNVAIIVLLILIILLSVLRGLFYQSTEENRRVSDKKRDTLIINISEKLKEESGKTRKKVKEQAKTTRDTVKEEAGKTRKKVESEGKNSRNVSWEVYNEVKDLKENLSSEPSKEEKKEEEETQDFFEGEDTSSEESSKSDSSSSEVVVNGKVFSPWDTTFTFEGDYGVAFKKKDDTLSSGYYPIYFFKKSFLKKYKFDIPEHSGNKYSENGEYFYYIDKEHILFPGDVAAFAAHLGNNKWFPYIIDSRGKNKGIRNNDSNGTEVFSKLDTSETSNSNSSPSQKQKSSVVVDTSSSFSFNSDYGIKFEKVNDSIYTPIFFIKKKLVEGFDHPRQEKEGEKYEENEEYFYYISSNKVSAGKEVSFYAYLGKKFLFKKYFPNMTGDRIEKINGQKQVVASAPE